MSAYPDLDLEASNMPTRSQLAAFVDDARGRYSALRDRSVAFASRSNRRAADLARTAGDQIRRRPVTTAVVATAIGVGLVFLLSRRARQGAGEASHALWGAMRSLH